MSHIQNPVVVMISDLHVGDPDNVALEDFDRDADFARLLSEEIPRHAGGGPATLVIAGDFVDFPQVMPELGKHDVGDQFGTTEAQSVVRMAKVIKGHPRVFEALRKFLEAGNQVLLLCGNHDIDFHFPGVFGTLHAVTGFHPGLTFVKEGHLLEKGLYIEHGNQYSYDNWFEHWDDPILTAPNGEKRIERPWGTLFMDIVYNDVETAYPFANKVWPHSALARIIGGLVRSDPRVSITTLARLAAFLVTKGKRAIGGWALGDEDEGAAQAPTASEVDQFVAAWAAALPEDRRKELAKQTVALTGASSDVTSHRDDGATEGLLGRSDVRGLDGRAKELFDTGAISVVAFGHTHEPVIRSEQRPARTVQFFNTGGWIPRILVAPDECPTRDELLAHKKAFELRYLVVDLRDGVKASLETLPFS